MKNNKKTFIWAIGIVLAVVSGVALFCGSIFGPGYVHDYLKYGGLPNGQFSNGAMEIMALISLFWLLIFSVKKGLDKI